jgi:hypothetical protein
MGQQICSGCGETNPLESVMCWACYTPLGDAAKREAHYAKIGNRLGVQLRPFVPRIIWGKMQGKGREDPIVRILYTIIDSALKDQAREIHVQPEKVELPREADGPQAERWNSVFGERRVGVHILYKIGDELREQMKVPGYILEPLVAEIKKRSKLVMVCLDERWNERECSYEGRFCVRLKGVSFDVPVLIYPSPLGEKVVISL